MAQTVAGAAEQARDEALFAKMHAAVRGRMDELVAVVIDDLRDAIPAYRDLSPEQLVDGVSGDIVRALDAVSGGRRATADELAGLEAVGEDRAHQGVPVEAVIQAFQLAADRTLDLALEEGRRLGAGPQSLLTYSRNGWTWANEAMTVAARAHRRAELELARRDAHQRDDLLRRLVLGSVPPGEVQLRLPLYGLRPGGAFAVVRARLLQDGADAAAWVERLRRRHPTGALLGMVEGDVVLVGPDVPDVPDTFCAGVAGPGAVAELPVLFADAGRAVDTAAAFGLPGRHRLGELGPLPAVVLDRRLGRLLHERCLAALGGPEEQERHCATFEALFAHGLRIPDAARALHVHENTVRKRLRQAQERTGLDLGRGDDLVAVWWAVRTHRAAGTAGVEAHTG